MQNPQQQIAMQIAQALQQGADPKELLGELVKMGMAQDQATSMIQSVMQSMQGQSQMAKGGYTGTWSGNQGFAHGGVSPYNYSDPYSTMMSMGGRVKMLPKAQVGLEKLPGTTSYKTVPPSMNPQGDEPREQDYPDYDSYMRALSSYYTQQYLPGVDLYNEPGVTDTIANIVPTDTGYQNPALAAITTPAAAVVAPQSTMTPSGYGTLHPEYSVVDLLNSLGAKSDYKTRAKLAKELGIDSYKGKDYQNLELIKRLSTFHNEIQKNPNDYDIAKLIAKVGSDSSSTVPSVDTTGIPTITPDAANAPYLGANGLKEKPVPVPGMSTTGKVLTGIGIAAGVPLAAATVYDVVNQRNKVAGIASKVPTHVSTNKALEVTRNQLVETAGKDLNKAYQDFKKLPKRQQESLIKDERVKMMLDEARAEEALVNARETADFVREAEMEAAVPTTKAGRAALRAAEVGRAARATERVTKTAGAAMNWLRGLGKAMKDTKFEMGGGYVPSYGEYAYGGYHSEIPRLFNQPVDRPNKAMYGAMMAAGGSFDNPGFKALPIAVQQKIMAASGKAMYGMGMARGGQMPQWLAERRFAAAGNTDQLSDYGYEEGGVVEIDPEDYEATIQKLRDGGYQFEVLR